MGGYTLVWLNFLSKHVKSLNDAQEEEKNNRESNLKAYHQLLDEYVLSVTSQWRKVPPTSIERGRK
jgi:hypothetical protein